MPCTMVRVEQARRSSSTRIPSLPGQIRLTLRANSPRVPLREDILTFSDTHPRVKDGVGAES